MKWYYCLFVIFITLFSSCVERANRYIYASQAANINYFKQKGDAKITGYYSGEGIDNNNGYNVQAGYALTNHLALMGSYTYKRENQHYGYDSLRYQRYRNWGTLDDLDVFDSSVIKYKRRTVELGLGYYLSLDKSKTVTFNLYTGVSLGKNSLSDAGLDTGNHNYSRFYNTSTTKYFVQGYFNFMPIEAIHISIGSKLSSINYHSVTTSYSNRELNFFYLDKMTDKTINFFEPFYNMQIAIPKYNWIKLDGQISLSNGLGYEYPKVRKVNLSIGLTVEVNKLLQKKHH